MPAITIYTTDYCSYCRAAKSLFDRKGAAYTEVDVTDDDEARTSLVARTGRTTVPQIWIGDRHVGGYDDLRALDRAGGLDPLLAAQG